MVSNGSTSHPWACAEFTLLVSKEVLLGFAASDFLVWSRGGEALGIYTGREASLYFSVCALGKVPTW